MEIQKQKKSEKHGSVTSWFTCMNSSLEYMFGNMKCLEEKGINKQIPIFCC